MFFPNHGDIFAPCEAVVEFIFPTRHALGLRHASGLEMLIHVGIDTVQLEGQGFEVLVKEGQSVQAGERLLKADLDFLQKNGKNTATMLVFTNLEEKPLMEWKKRGTITHEDTVAIIR